MLSHLPPTTRIFFLTYRQPPSPSSSVSRMYLPSIPTVSPFLWFYIKRGIPEIRISWLVLTYPRITSVLHEDTIVSVLHRRESLVRQSQNYAPHAAQDTLVLLSTYNTRGLLGEGAYCRYHCYSPLPNVIASMHLSSDPKSGKQVGGKQIW